MRDSYTILKYDPEITEKLKDIFAKVDKVYMGYSFYPEYDDNEKRLNEIKEALKGSDYEFLKDDGVSIGCTDYIIKRTDGRILKISSGEDVWFNFCTDESEFKDADDFFDKRS